MLLRYSYTTLITFSAKVTDHAFAMRCAPMESVAQRTVWQKLSVVPSCRLTESIDAFGNKVLSGYIGRRHDVFAYEAAGLVQRGQWADLTPPGQVYSHPSPLTQPSPALEHAAATLGAPQRGSAQDWVERLMTLLSRSMTYAQGVTDVSTTAAQAWDLGQGVCQDFAHAAVTICRLAGLPARYVCGLMLGEGATHAWVETYADGRWIAFDPTNSAIVADTYIKMAHGRDYSDCSISRGAFRGCATQAVRVGVDVWQAPQGIADI